MNELLRRGAAFLALAFIALHVPFLPASLEDLDSINFALGIRDFDVASHQPHPPGYPVFIAAAKVVHVAIANEARALGLLGVVAGGLALLVLAGLFVRTDDRAEGRIPLPLLAAILVATSPLYWMTSARPLSDMSGLAVALAAQYLAIGARSRRPLMIAALVAALGAGIRSQVVWLTLPVLTAAVLRQPAGARVRSALEAGSAYVAGTLVWAVPLVLLAGGPGGYLRALASQGAEDFTGVVMLWTTPTVRQLARALVNTFVAPWAFLPSAIIVLVFASIGFAVMLLRHTRSLGWLIVAFGPYLIFHLLFQETATTRYALPLAVPVAYAAVRGVSYLSQPVGAAAVLAFSLFNVFVGSQALYWYSAVEPPAFQMLRDMKAATPGAPPVVAMHRRDDLDLRRPILWAGLPGVGRRLAAPPKLEWMEVVKYWNDGGRRPVWFVADPPRSDLALFRRQRPPVRYRWAFEMPMVMGGVRPNEMDWYVLEPPDWYLAEGWAITPETAGLAKETGRGPGQGGINGWIRRWPGDTNLVIGGRNLTMTGREAHVTVAVDGRNVDEARVPPGFFLRALTLPQSATAGGSDYALVTVTADNPDLAVEQFDAQPAGRVVFGYGEGWNELEYNPVTGRLWRWTTERATLRARGSGQRLTLRFDGELEEASSSRVVVRSGERVLAERQVDRVFSMDVDIPEGVVGTAETPITIETSAWYIPAEKRFRSRDQRHLGLKIYSCQLAPAS